ncbi:US6 [Gallid alphaherpesvirus 2]|nr:US6 [Gallid alphaherpesvirus 2]
MNRYRYESIFFRYISSTRMILIICLLLGTGDMSAMGLKKDNSPIIPTLHPKGNENLRATLNEYKIPSPLFDTLDNSYETKHVIYTDNCSFAVLNPFGDPKYTLLSLLLMGRRKYDALVAWFVLGRACGRPIYLREYANCSTNEPFGTCKLKSLGWWDRRYAMTSYIDRDELKLIIAAPSRELSGLYTRLIIINGEPISSDILLTVKETCSFSRRGIKDNKLCKPFSFFVNGTTRLLDMVGTGTPRAHEENVKQWLERIGGKHLPIVVETSMQQVSNLPRSFRDSYLKSPDDDKYNDVKMTSATTNNITTSVDGYTGLTNRPEDFEKAPYITKRPIISVEEASSQSPKISTEKKSRTQIIISLVVLCVMFCFIVIGSGIWILRKHRKTVMYDRRRPSRRAYSRL